MLLPVLLPRRTAQAVVQLIIIAELNPKPSQRCKQRVQGSGSVRGSAQGREMGLGLKVACRGRLPVANLTPRLPPLDGRLLRRPASEFGKRANFVTVARKAWPPLFAR